MCRIAEATPAASMLERIYIESNRNRTRPCVRTSGDPFRVFWYDVMSAADFSDHTLPLLVRRHNVVPGMFLVRVHARFFFLLFYFHPTSCRFTTRVVSSSAITSSTATATLAQISSGNCQRRKKRRRQDKLFPWTSSSGIAPCDVF